MKEKKTRSLRFCPKCGKYCFTLAGSFTVPKCLKCRVRSEPTGLAMMLIACIVTGFIFWGLSQDFNRIDKDTASLLLNLLLGFIWFFPIAQWYRQYSAKKTQKNKEN